MTYVFWNIFWCLLGAAILGGIAGWLLKQFLGGKRLAELDADWQMRFSGLEGERDRVAAAARESDERLTSLRTKHSSLEADFGALKKDLSRVSGRIPELEAELTTWKNASAAWDVIKSKLATEVKACGETRASLEAELGKWNARFAAWDDERTKLLSDVDGWKRKAAMIGGETR